MQCASPRDYVHLVTKSAIENAAPAMVTVVVAVVAVVVEVVVVDVIVVVVVSFGHIRMIRY